MDDELKLPLMLSLFGYDFLYKKLEFDESIGCVAVDSNNAVVDGDDDDEDSDDDVGDTDAQFPLAALLPVGPPPLSPMRDCRITLCVSVSLPTQCTGAKSWLPGARFSLRDARVFDYA